MWRHLPAANPYHTSCAKFCAHPLVFSRRKNSWPMSTRFEGGKQDFSSLKGDAAGILSEFRHRGISTSGFFWRIDARDGYMSLQELSGLELVSHRIFGGFFGFSLSRNRILSHGWILVVSKAILSRTMISRGAQIMLRM